MKIEQINTSELKQYQNNSRTHSDKQVQQIAQSIKEFGFTNPILVDDNNEIIAGHGRLMGALSLEMEKVPCIRLTGLTEKQKRAYVIADNKIAENSDWDFDILKSEVANLSEEDYDLDILGFNEELIDSILEPIEEEEQEEIKPKESKPTANDSSNEYESSSIRQIILIYGSEEYTKVIESLHDYSQKNDLGSNTEAVNHLLISAGYEI